MTLRVLFTVALVTLPAAGRAQAPAYPKATVAGKHSAFTLYLPDDARGFYRGVRFDRGGVIGNWEVNGVTLFGPWKGTHDPANADDITGPCEEFDQQTPPGYAAAAPGGTFVKVGVGELVKETGEPYQFMHRYRVADAGKRTHVAAGAKHTFTHELDAKCGIAYTLVKTVESADDARAAVLKLRSTITNRGKTPLTTRVYNHNFFNANADPVGPAYAIDWGRPLTVTKSEARFAELCAGGPSRLTFTGKLAAGQIYAEYAPTEPAGGYTFTMHHKPTGTAVEVSSDRPASALRVWGVSTCLCPEPFVTIDALPRGESFSWATTYRVPLANR
jgi:hypothetical protein